MNYMNYMVVDGDGNACTDGLQPHEAYRVAQAIADRMGEPVWLCPSGNEGDPDADEECDTPDGERINPTVYDEEGDER